MTDRDMPDDPAELYKAILRYGLFYPTAALTSVQIRALPSGLTYGEILERLGRTKDTGRDEHAYQYTVDGDKVLLLRFRMEEDICPHSGEELLAALEDAGQPSQSGDTFRAVLQERYESERTAKPTGRCWSSARIGSGSTVSICRYRTIQSSNTRTDGPPFSRISEDRSR